MVIRRMGLQGRIVMLGLLALAPIVLMQVGAAEAERQAARAQAQGEALVAARTIADQQDQWLTTIEATFDVWALTPAIQQRDAPACTTIVSQLRRQFPSVTNFWAALPDGTVFCSSQPTPPSFTTAGRPWFEQALATKRFTVGAYQIGSITGRAVLPVARPVLNDEGDVIAVLATALDLAWLERSFAVAELPSMASLTLLDRKGVVLARIGDGDQWRGRSVTGTALGGLVGQDVPVNATALDLDGAERLFGFATGSVDATGVRVAVGIPTSAVDARARRTMTRGLAVTIAITFAAILIAWFGSELLILRPVRRLIDAAQRVSAGDRTARSQVAHDETDVGQLARAFDEMAERIETEEHETRRATAAHRANERWLARVLETTAEGLMIADTDGRCTMANPAVERIFGIRDRRALIGRHTFESRFRRFNLDGSPLLPEQHPFMLVKASGQPVRDFEYMMEARGGRLITLSVSAAPLWDDDGAFAGVVSCLVDVTDRKQHEADLALHAFYDMLTRLPNRRLFSDRLARVLAEQQRPDDQAAVLFLDLDGFKQVNDRFGHAAGDQLLAEVSRRIEHCLWPGDSAARFGGDEFAVLSPHVADRRLILSLADDLLAAIATPVRVEGGEAAITASIGIAFVSGTAAQSDQVMREADTALYRAKRAGKSRYVIAAAGPEAAGMPPLAA